MASLDAAGVPALKVCELKTELEARELRCAQSMTTTFLSSLATPSPHPTTPTHPTPPPQPTPHTTPHRTTPHHNQPRHHAARRASKPPWPTDCWQHSRRRRKRGSLRRGGRSGRPMRSRAPSMRASPSVRSAWKTWTPRFSRARNRVTTSAVRRMSQRSRIARGPLASPLASPLGRGSWEVVARWVARLKLTQPCTAGECLEQLERPKKCPECRGPVGVRNRAIERMVANLVLPCKWSNGTRLGSSQPRTLPTTSNNLLLLVTSADSQLEFDSFSPLPPAFHNPSNYKSLYNLPDHHRIRRGCGGRVRLLGHQGCAG